MRKTLPKDSKLNKQLNKINKLNKLRNLFRKPG